MLPGTGWWSGIIRFILSAVTVSVLLGKSEQDVVQTLQAAGWQQADGIKLDKLIRLW